MRGAIPPLPQYVFMAWFSVKYKENFTFTFTFTFCLGSELITFFAFAPFILMEEVFKPTAALTTVDRQ
jgi:hypothetical protein